MTVVVVVEGLVILILAVLVVGLLRSHAEILRRLHELGAGVYDEDDDTVGGDAHDHTGIRSSVALTANPSFGTQPGPSFGTQPGPSFGTQPGPSFGTQPGVAAPGRATTPAHDIAGITATGSSKAIGVTGVEHSTLLAFLSSGCGTCQGFWSAFAAGEADELPGTDTRLVIVTRGLDRESQSAVAELAPRQHPTVMSSEAFDDYEVEVNPYFILVDGPSGGVVGEGAASTWEQVVGLLRQAAADNGLATSSNRQGREAAHLNGIEREKRADDELAAAGIGPGHASLYPDSIETPLDDVDSDASSGTSAALDAPTTGVER